MAKKNDFIAVITGDIVDSGEIQAGNRDKMPEKLKRIFAELASAPDDLPQFSIFRGDSFQGVIPDPAEALRNGLWIRTALLRAQSELGSYDTRLAIGIGKVTYMAATVMESDGEAFRHSGAALDSMEPDERLQILTPWDAVNQELQVHCALMNVLMSRWTATQAGIIAETLLGKTQRAVADTFGITQPAVSSSLKASGWNAVEALLARYQFLVKNHIQ